MSNVILPESGSVVVIDDQINEALPIIKLLSKKGIASTYYSGSNDDELPASPLQKIRIVFLDLQLFPSNDAHVIATNLVNKLKKIVSAQNGPYLLIIWSQKRSLYGEQLRVEINKPEHNIVPASILEFEKSDCLKEMSNEEDNEELIEDIGDKLKDRFPEDDYNFIIDSVRNSVTEKANVDILYEANENAFNIIEKNIKEKLVQAGAFHLFVLWENIINRSSGVMIEKLSSSAPMDKEWERNMGSIFYQMGKARVSKSENDPNVFLKESLKTFNYSFIDTVENNISAEPFPEHIKVNEENLLVNSFGANTYALKRKGNNYLVEKNGTRIGNENKDLSVVHNSIGDAGDKGNVGILLSKFKVISPLLNTKLHIESNPYEIIFPGNVYERSDVKEDRKKEIIGKYVKEIVGNLADYKLIELEVSPICDFAQENWIRSRRISGLLYPSESVKLQDAVKEGESYYQVEPSFMLEGRIYKIIFAQRLFKSVELADVKEKPIFRIKRELLLDIIAHLSSHVNRPGIMFVK